MKLAHILAPHDGSLESLRLIQAVCNLYEPLEPVVTLLRALPPRVDPAMAALARRDLELTTEWLADQTRLQLQQLVVAGAPAETILARAADTAHPVDLIAMATHGRHGLNRWLRGSQTEAVLRQTRVPMLVANPRSLGSLLRQPQQILVPLDGSQRARAVLPHVRLLAEAHHAHVALLHVLPATPASVGTGGAGIPGKPELPPGAGQGLGILDPEREQLTAAGVPASGEVRWGRVETELLAATRAADLAVMTTRGSRGLERALLGSVCEHVLRRSACPVLALRIPRAADLEEAAAEEGQEVGARA